MKKLLLVAAMLIGASCAAGAQTPRVDRIEIEGVGTIDSTTDNRVKDPTVASGYRIEARDFKIRNATTRIPAILGEKFGLIFTIEGHPYWAAVNLRGVMIFPPEGLLNPSTGQRLYREEYLIQTRIGRQRMEGWTLNNDWEIVPGEWTLQIWDADRLLVEQKFILYRPLACGLDGRRFRFAPS